MLLLILLSSSSLFSLLFLEIKISFFSLAALSFLVSLVFLTVLPVFVSLVSFTISLTSLSTLFLGLKVKKESNLPWADLPDDFSILFKADCTLVSLNPFSSTKNLSNPSASGFLNLSFY